MSSRKTPERPHGVTIFVEKELKEKMRIIGYHQSRKLTGVIYEAMKDVVRKYEEENGPIEVGETS